jgi:hypothetical protein
MAVVFISASSIASKGVAAKAADADTEPGQRSPAAPAAHRTADEAARNSAGHGAC